MEKHMVHEIIELTKQPSLPFPFGSVDAGEAWVWGDYVATMQTEPRTAAERMMDIANVPKTDIPPIDCPFVLSVYYRNDRNRMALHCDQSWWLLWK